MGRVSTCQKNCNTIDLRGAQVNEIVASIVCFTDLLAVRYRSVNGHSERYENGPHRRDICRGFPVRPEVMQQ